MKYIRRVIYVVLISTILLACQANKNEIIIEDFVLGADYEVIKVDGNPVKRAKHGSIATVVPVVLVSEGIHNLTVKYNKISLNNKEYDPVDIQVEIKQDKRYRLVNKNEKPTLVEINEK
ncbi:MAG: hypothetical protein OEZ38_14415 [Gammaproteobacteria bacterium]|nr:hypothetical protein [Gammaproteobacteria bacterium]